MTEYKLITKNQISQIVETSSLVLVTGVFDLLHLGHMYFLDQAKKQAGEGCKLLVIVLNDANVKSRKGEDRPIFSEKERAQGLAYLDSVDYVMVWNQKWEDLRNFVLEIKPKFLAVVEGDSGIENKRQHIESVGGKLLVIPQLANYSTSSIISQFTTK